MLARIQVLVGTNAAGRTFFKFVGQALARQLAVEQGVQMAVGGFLPDEAAQVFLKSLPL